MTALIEKVVGGVLVASGPEIEQVTLTTADLALLQIKALEDKYNMARVTRESLIALAEERGAAMGLTPAQLLVKNKGYAGLKALDAQIAALREQL